MSTSRTAAAATQVAAARHRASSSAPENERIRGIDGLRGLAVAAVVAFHAFPALLPGGFVGVDVFFVISGFLITRGLLVQTSPGRLSLKVFYSRRAQRILPALLMLVLTWAVVIAVVGGPLGEGFVQQVVAALTFSSNWNAITTDQNYFLESAPVVFKHLWSLAIEEQFYLLWPLILLLLLKTRPHTRILTVLTLSALSAAAMAVIVSPQTISRAYYGTDTHSFGLLAGASAALIAARLRRSSRQLVAAVHLIVLPAGVVFLIWVALHVHGEAVSTYRGALIAVAAVTAALLTMLAAGGKEVGVVLDVFPLAELGRRSYGIYLWHWPFLVVAGVLVPTSEHGSPLDVVVRLSAVVAAVSCAWFSFRFIEQPVLHHPRVGHPHPVRVPRPLIVTAALTAAAGIITATAVVAERPSAATAAERQIAAGTAALARHQHAVSSAAPRPRQSPATSTPAVTPPTSNAPGAPSPTPPTASQLPSAITAIGDSVMLAAAPALLHQFPDADINAHVSRQPSTAPAILRALAAQGRLDQIVVVGLGTNGALGTSTLNEIRAAIGDRELVLVDVWADRPWAAGVNKDLHAYAADHPHTVVAHWHDAITARQQLLGPDHIHPGPAGGRLYARTIAAAIRSSHP